MRSHFSGRGRILLLLLLAVSACGDAGGGAPAGGGGAWKFENPLLRGEPGEWALYETMDGATYRWELLEIDRVARKVRYLEEIRRGDVNRLESRGPREVGLNHFLWGFQPGVAVVRRIFIGRVRAAGRTWDALCVEQASPMHGLVRSWFSQEVPVLGLIRREKLEGGKTVVVHDLVDWSGRTGK